MPSDSNRSPTEARRSGSSSMTNTVEFASDIAATRIKGSRKCALSRFTGLGGVVVPIHEPEQPHPPPEGGINKSLRPLTVLRRHFPARTQAIRAGDKPKFTGHSHCTKGILCTATQFRPTYS